MPIAIVDSGPLYASIDADDDDHLRSVDILLQTDLQLVIPAMVVAEVSYLVGRRLGASIEARFLAGLNHVSVVAPYPEDWQRIAALVVQYSNFPLGGTDASVVALAERLNTEVIITLDHRHFRAIRPSHCPAFRLLP